MKEQESINIDPLKLRVARVGRRLRQRDVALRLGIAPQRISDFETGVRRPTSEQLARLTEALGPSILATDESDQDRP